MTADITEPAPFYEAVAEGPANVAASWVRAADGTRLRMAVWPTPNQEGGSNGTVLMFPGRTEYVEKYGRVASDLAENGYGMVAFDWRGQGLADRPPHRRDMGHVLTFDEYRQDVTAFLKAMEPMNLPKPWFLIGHSMGGCIGLRALYDGLDVEAATFTGPMWGLQMSNLLRTLQPAITKLAGPMGFGKTFAPTTGPWEPLEFEDNSLTTDRDQFDYMFRQTDVHPELALGGPSLSWVKAALWETEDLMEKTPLDLPALAIVGTGEQIVDVDAARTRMASWPKGSYLSIEGGRHEVLMEADPLRDQSLDAILALFRKAAR
ncbi:alpha/beta fold hydrolase [Jannaschia sp. CCS1]|uniref:alpha/beta fold hydrolase n=1 Tax=Jannaschia sp. (strain CCS1) TaxID=290400 RepID=UPI0005C43645|nr:alpha/beta hydrolase [Jannaschia sp. CCS1]